MSLQSPDVKENVVSLRENSKDLSITQWKYKVKFDQIFTCTQNTRWLQQEQNCMFGFWKILV